MSAGNFLPTKKDMKAIPVKREKIVVDYEKAKVYAVLAGVLELKVKTVRDKDAQLEKYRKKIIHDCTRNINLMFDRLMKLQDAD